MLPEKLSTDLTSLAEGDDRLAIVVEIEVGADGALGTPTSTARSSRIARSSLTTASPRGSTEAGARARADRGGARHR